MTRQNCWEFMGCGREPGGTKADEFGVCPATLETRLDGVHGGTNAGRACWVVAGTLCRSKVSGSFALNNDCLTCDFYHRVIEEEMPDFMFTPKILGIIDKDPPD